MADVLGEAVSFYEMNRRGDMPTILGGKTTGKYLEYLANRGINERAMEYFRLGHTAEPGALSDFMQHNGYSLDSMLDAGLMHEYSENFFIETFRDSVIIPYLDEEGRVLNISARKMDGAVPKYINLPHSRIHGYFGLHAVKDRFRYRRSLCADTVFITEGQLDTIKLHQEGLFALGVLGTNAIRPNMFGGVLGLFDAVVACFDPDMPGQKAAATFVRHVAYYHPHVKLYNIKLPDGKDANEFLLENSAQDMCDLIQPIKDVSPLPFKDTRRILTPGTPEEMSRVALAKQVKITSAVAAIQPHAPVVRSGGQYKTICPFKDHTEHVGSFTMYNANNSFFCFGCGRGGDVITFVQEYFGCSFKEAIKILLRETDESTTTE